MTFLALVRRARQEERMPGLSLISYHVQLSCVGWVPERMSRPNRTAARWLLATISKSRSLLQVAPECAMGRYATTAAGEEVFETDFEIFGSEVKFSSCHRDTLMFRK